MNEQHLSRVSTVIGESIIAFFGARLASGYVQFNVDELRRHVSKEHPVAPASPDRVMRDLRQKGQLNYRVVSRRASLYEALPLGISSGK